MAYPNSIEQIQALIQQGDAVTALRRANDTVGRLRPEDFPDVRERALAFNQAWYGLALAQHASGQMSDACESARQAFEFDALEFEQQPDMVRIAIAARNWPFAGLVAGHCASLVERHGEQDAADEIIAMIEPVERESPLFVELLNGEVHGRYDARYGAEEPQGNNRMVAELRGLGMAEDDLLLHGAFGAHELGDDDLALRLWSQVNWRAAPRPYSFANYAMLCLRKGLPTPDPMQLAGQRDAELLYNGGTHVVTLLTEDAELKAMSREQARPWWALAAAILQHGFDRYAAFENGERNGYAVDAHFFAMLCNNLGIALGKLNLHDRACQVHERGLLTSPFMENAQNALYEATLTDDAAAARRCSEHMGRFLQDYGNYLDTAQQCRFQSLMLAAAGYSDTPDVWFEKLRVFNQQWGYMRKQARFMNSDEHHLPLEWSYLKREHNQAINDQWRSLKILHKRASQDPRVITCMLRNRRDHASEEARAEGLALAEQALHVLAPLKDTPEGTRYWFEARYSLAYLRYRSWFYQSSVVGQDWLPQARKEFEVVLAQHIEGDPEAIDAMLDYGMLLVREILDLPEGIVWLTRVIQALEPQPRPRGGERRWDPKTAPDPALALAYLFRAQAYSLQDQDLNSSVRSDLEQAGALNPWLPGVWYWMATVECESGNAMEAIAMAERFVDFDGDNRPWWRERADMLSALVTLQHAVGNLPEAQRRLAELESLGASAHEDLPALRKLLNPGAAQAGKSLWGRIKGLLG